MYRGTLMQHLNMPTKNANAIFYKKVLSLNNKAYPKANLLLPMIHKSLKTAEDILWICTKHNLY